MSCLANSMVGNFPSPLAQLTVEPIFGWWAVALLALITVASLYLTLSATEISRSGRALLAGLRILATCVLILGWLRPAFLSTSQRENEAAIAVLLDRSLSMTLPSDSVGRTRWDVQRDVWQAIVDATGSKIGGSKLIPYFFDKSLIAIDQKELPHLETSLKPEPAGRLTDLGAALTEVGKTQTNPPLRGVVVMGDAAQTQLPPQLDPLLVARQMAQMDQPIFFVGIGSRGEGNTMKDVAIESMPEEISAFASKEVSVPLVVSAMGMQNQPIDVTLTLRSAQQPDQVLKQRRIFPSQPAEKIPLDFRIQLKEAGDYLVVAEARVDTTEQISSNNQLLSFVTVREGGVRILMLEGQPRYEQRYLKLSLDASVDFDLEYAWLPQRTQKQWPIDISKSIDLESFEVYVIGDLDSAAIHPAAQQRIAARVAEGAGLLLLGGYHSFDAGGYQNSPLAQAVPLQMQPKRQLFNQRIDPALHIQEPVQLIPTRPHPVTSLLPEPDNTRLWESLKPMDGMNRFGKLASTPGTQVLLADAQGRPALVAGQLGRGRVLAFAADSTWKWYLSGQDSGQKRAHQTFWRQAMLWLVSRDKLQEGFRMVIDSRRQDIDATPGVNIEWFGGTDNAPMPSNIQLTLSRESKQLRSVETVAAGENKRECTLTGLDQPGLYEVALSSTSQSGKQYQAELAFLVQDTLRELLAPEADWQLMANLVAAGAASGSELFLPEETGKLIAKIRQRDEAAKVSQLQRRSLGDEAWDSWLFVLVFSGLMSTEWALRKRWQLP